MRQVVDENERGYLPPLKTSIDSIKNYDTVFVGFPAWGMQLPPPVKTFFRRNDLSGSTVVLFNTHAPYGVGSGFETVKALCRNSSVLEGFSTNGGAERDGIYFVVEGEKEKQVRGEITKWLQKIELIKE